MYFPLFFKKFKQTLYTQICAKDSKLSKKDATIKAMDKVEFIEQNEFHIKSRRLFGEPTTPSMVSFLLRTGLAKNEKQAVFILFTVISLTLILTLSLIYGKSSSANDTVVDQQGNSYTFEQYINLVKQGKDPLLK